MKINWEAKWDYLFNGLCMGFGLVTGLEVGMNLYTWIHDLIMKL